MKYVPSIIAWIFLLLMVAGIVFLKDWKFWPQAGILAGLCAAFIILDYKDFNS